MTTTTLRKPKPAPLLSEFGPTLDAFLMVARAHEAMRRASEKPIKDPQLTKQMRRRIRDVNNATRDRAKAVSTRDWDAVSKANSTIRSATKELREAREAQLAAADRSRASFEAAMMATIRGEHVEDVDVVVTEWLTDEDGVRVVEDGNAVLVERRSRTARVMSRTGLRLAYERGYLDGSRKATPEVLYAMGLRYREAFEVVSVTGLGTTGEERIGTPRCKPSVGPADALLEASLVLAALRTNLTQRQRDVLDAVCGRDESVKAAAQLIRSGVPVAKRHLLAGLVTVWSNRALPFTREERNNG